MEGKTVLITSKNITYPETTNIEVYRSLDTIPITSSINLIITDTLTETKEEVILNLIQKGRYENLYYIATEIDEYLAFLVTALGGYVYRDEGNYLSLEALEWILTSKGQTGLEVLTENVILEKVVSILARIESDVAKGDIEKIVNFLTSKDVEKLIKQSKFDLQDIITIKQNVETESVKLLRNLKQTLDEAQKTKTELDRRMAELRFEYNTRMEDKSEAGIDIYPTYHVPDASYKVMYVKKYSEATFLNTLLLSYSNYLRHKMNKTVKVLFVIPKSTNVIKKFNGFPLLTKAKISLIDLDASTVFVTTEPNRTVWSSFFAQRGIHLFIIIDLTYSEPLLRGEPVKAFGAVGSLKDIGTFNLQRELTFTPLLNANTLVVQPIPQFRRMNDTQKLESCYTKHIALFEKLNYMLGV